MTTWPYPDRPGVPLDPEIERHHWLKIDGDIIAADWADGEWMWGDRVWTPDDVVLWGYLGPCLLPDEVKAREIAARLGEREMIANKIGDFLREAGNSGEKDKSEPADNRTVIMLILLAEMLPKVILELPAPKDDALDTLIATTLRQAAAVAHREKDRLWALQREVPDSPQPVTVNSNENLRLGVAARAGTASEIARAIEALILVKKDTQT